MRGRRSYNIQRSGPPAPSTNFGPGYGQNVPHKPPYNGSQRGAHFNFPQKRDHNTAFNSTPQQHQQQRPHHRPRPTAAPAVPHFNASLEHILASKPSKEQQKAQKSSELRKAETKRQNLLGLTPAKFDPDSDPEDDEGEEIRLANKCAVASSALGGGHTFEYNGSPLLLRNRDEILAWLTERRKRYPTAARREAARREAEEKKKRREEEFNARLQAKKEAEAKKHQERAERQKAKEQEKQQARRKHEKRSHRNSNDGAAQQQEEDATADTATFARLKAEKLRKRALKAQQELERAEEALRLAQEKKQKHEAHVAGRLGSRSDDGPVHPEQIPPALQPDAKPATEVLGNNLFATAVEDDATSSSGSSSPASSSASEASDSDPDPDPDSASDSAPEVESAKAAFSRTQHAKTFPPPRRAAPAPRPGADVKRPEMCKIFLKRRSCHHGTSCRYSHDLSALSSKRPARRKGLYQVMVEKEVEEERRKLLSAIIALGERGVLDSSEREER